MNKTKSKSNNKVIINRIKFLQRIPRQLAIQRFIPIPAFYAHFSVYPHFSVLSAIQLACVQPNLPRLHFSAGYISAFYPQFSVLFPFQFPFSDQFQRFIPNSAFYPHFSFRFQISFSVLSPIQRFIPISVSVFRSVSAFYPDPPDQGLFKNKAIHTHLRPVEVVLDTLNCKLTSL